MESPLKTYSMCGRISFMKERRGLFSWRRSLSPENKQKLQDAEVAAHINAYAKDRAASIASSRLLKNLGFSVFLVAGAAVLVGPGLVPLLPVAALGLKVAAAAGGSLWLAGLGVSAFGLGKEMINKQATA